MLEVLRGSAVAFAIRVSGALMSFGFAVLLARIIGVEGVGVYMMALMVVSAAAVLGRLGQDNAMLRFIAAADDWTAVRGVFAGGCRLVFVASASTTVLTWLLAPLIADRVFDEPTLFEPLRLMSLAIAPVAFVWVLSASLRGLLRIRDAQLLQHVLVPAFGVALLGILAAGGYSDVRSAIWAFIVSNVLVVVLGVRLWRRANRPARNVDGVFDGRKLLRTGLPLLGVASTNLINGWVATTTLGIYRSAEEVGLYNIALRTALLMSFVLTSFVAVAAPKFSALWSKGDRVSLARVTVTSTRVMTLLTLPLLLLFVLAPKVVLRLFGGAFDAAAPVLVILAAGQFFGVACGMMSPLLVMSGHERVLRNIFLVSASTNVVLCCVFVPGAGIKGAAYATACSWVLSNVLAVVAVRRILGILGHVLARGRLLDVK